MPNFSPEDPAKEMVTSFKSNLVHTPFWGILIIMMLILFLLLTLVFAKGSLDIPIVKKLIILKLRHVILFDIDAILFIRSFLADKLNVK